MPDQAQALDNRNRGYGATRKEVERRSTLDFKAAMSEGEAAAPSEQLLKTQIPAGHRFTDLFQN